MHKMNLIVERTLLPVRAKPEQEGGGGRAVDTKPKKKGKECTIA